MPRICVCTAPATPTVHKSDDDEFTDGVIAEGGGEITIVFPLVVISESLFVVVSTTVCAKNGESRR